MSSKTLEEKPNPQTPSSDYRSMFEFWSMVEAIVDGVDHLRRAYSTGSGGAVSGPKIPYASLQQLSAYRRGRGAAQSPYLPQLPNEQNLDYEVRRKHAPLTNVYNDVSENLSSKPFSKTLELDETTSDDLKTLAENVDGQGNSLHVFSSVVFKAGIDYGIDWILIDFDNAAPPPTLADERARGLKPYWVRIPAIRMLAVYSDYLAGSEVIRHARIYEPSIEQDGFDEMFVERVRIFNRDPILEDVLGADGAVVDQRVTGYLPATWELHELQTIDEQNSSKDTKEWVRVGSGDVSIGIIPLVAFKTGQRDGTSWKVRPPLKDIAYMQIEEFQQESNLKSVKDMTAFPMLAGNGVSPPSNEKGEQLVVPVGPKAVLFAPPQMDGRGTGSWNWIEPNSSSLTFLKSDLDGLRDEMRNLGRQPLATANLTVVTTANVSLKAHSAVQAWALGLKDALEQAWKITCMWLGQKDVSPIVKIHTDFGVDFEAGTELAALQAARAAKDLSQRTFWDELKRRGTLSDDFDPDAEEEALAEEQQGLVPEVPIDPITGKPILQPGGQQVVDPVTGKMIPAPGTTPPQLRPFANKAKTTTQNTTVN